MIHQTLKCAEVTTVKKNCRSYELILEFIDKCEKFYFVAE